MPVYLLVLLPLYLENILACFVNSTNSVFIDIRSNLWSKFFLLEFKNGRFSNKRVVYNKVVLNYSKSYESSVLDF